MFKRACTWMCVYKHSCQMSAAINQVRGGEVMGVINALPFHIEIRGNQCVSTQLISYRRSSAGTYRARARMRNGAIVLDARPKARQAEGWDGLHATSDCKYESMIRDASSFTLICFA